MTAFISTRFPWMFHDVPSFYQPHSRSHIWFDSKRIIFAFEIENKTKITTSRRRNRWKSIYVDYEFMTWQSPSVHSMARESSAHASVQRFSHVFDVLQKSKSINTAFPLFLSHWSMTIILALQRTLSNGFQSCEFHSLKTYLINNMLRRRKTADIKVWESFMWEIK